MRNTEWVRCPVCGNKSRTQIRDDTVLIHFPLFCPKCKQTTLINVTHKKMMIITEPDAKTQSQSDCK